MPKSPSLRLPKLCLHRATNRACVTLSGRETCCGAWGSPEAERTTYRTVVAEFLANGRVRSIDKAAGCTVAELAIDLSPKRLSPAAQRAKATPR